jgi:DNA-directed RNA polymerase subunit N (RpoN/RPB10)
MTGHVLRRLAPDAETIVKLYTEGASLDDLGIRWHCHPSTIRRLLVSQNVQLRRTATQRKLDDLEADIAEALEDGENIFEVARRFQVRPAAVARLLVAKSTAISN